MTKIETKTETERGVVAEKERRLRKEQNREFLKGTKIISIRGKAMPIHLFWLIHIDVFSNHFNRFTHSL